MKADRVDEQEREDENRGLADRLGVDDPGLEALFDTRPGCELLHEAFALLSEKERGVLCALYGIGRAQVSQSDYARETRCTRQYVFSTHMYAIHKLRRMLSRRKP
jgi:hypothetical protein